MFSVVGKDEGSWLSVKEYLYLSPAYPDVPLDPDVPVVPEVPDVPVVPDVPEVPSEPVAPVAPPPKLESLCPTY